MTGRNSRSWSGKQTLKGFASVFSPEGLELLTPALIDELRGRGWPAGQLRFAAVQGFRYNRVRNSLVLLDGMNAWPVHKPRR
jgi:hypothetical protein